MSHISSLVRLIAGRRGWKCEGEREKEKSLNLTENNYYDWNFFWCGRWSISLWWPSLPVKAGVHGQRAPTNWSSNMEREWGNKQRRDNDLQHIWEPDFLLLSEMCIVNWVSANTHNNNLSLLLVNCRSCPIRLHRSHGLALVDVNGHTDHLFRRFFFLCNSLRKSHCCSTSISSNSNMITLAIVLE